MEPSSEDVRIGSQGSDGSQQSYRDSLGWLFGTQLFGIKLGLENMQRLLAALDLPDERQRIVHVAGTNGKGSVCAIIASICQAQGYRTGLFTSPHLVSFRERIQVSPPPAAAGVSPFLSGPSSLEMISESAVAVGLCRIRDLIAGWDPHPTFFEIATALALQHFKDTSCEIVVLETGMGGRLDATNSVTPVVSVITPIDLDHQKWLGETLPEIAIEKAGIIKLGVPAVSAKQQSAAEAVLRAKAKECEAPLSFICANLAAQPVNLLGRHQQDNAAVAVAALRAGGIEVSERAIHTGLAQVTWPARFEQWDERIVIDGAHNPAGARSLVQTWSELFGDARATVILAILRDKDAAELVRALAPIAVRFLLPQIRAERALPATDLETIMRRVAPEVPVTALSSLTDALREAESGTSRILLTGSLHFAGEALALLRGQPDQLEDCLQ